MFFFVRLFHCNNYHCLAAQQDDTPDGAGEDEEEKEEKEKVRLTALFIQHMQENSFSKQLAIKALKNDIDPSNLDEGKPIVLQSKQCDQSTFLNF